MKLKRFVAIVISLAMVLSIVPAFSLTAGAAAGSSYSIEFELVDIGSSHRDLGITDANGKVFTGFCLATASDGFFAFDGERSFSSPLPNGATAGTTTHAGASKGETGITYTTGDKVTVTVTNNAEGTGYTVVYAIGDTYRQTREYTGATVNGISTPDKWGYGTLYDDNQNVTASNIYNSLKKTAIYDSNGVAGWQQMGAAYDFTVVNSTTLDSTIFSNASGGNKRDGYAVFALPDSLMTESEIQAELTVTVQEPVGGIHDGTVSVLYYMSDALPDSSTATNYFRNAVTYTTSEATMSVPATIAAGNVLSTGKFTVNPAGKKYLIVCLPQPTSDSNAGSKYYRYTETNGEYLTVSTKADVIVNYVDTDDGTVAGSYTTQNYVGTTFAPSITASYYASETTGYLYSVGAAPEAINVTAGGNTVTIPVTKFKQLVKATDATTYNYVQNGDFETGDMTGYDAAFASSTNFAVVDGKNNEGSKVLKHTQTANWSGNTYDGIGGDRSFQKLVTSIESGKNYFYSIDVYENGSGGLFSSFAFTNGKLTAATLTDGSAVVYPADGCLSSVSGTGETAGLQRADFNYPYQWHTYSGLVTAPESATAFEFDVYYLCDGKGTMFDNVQFYQIKDLQTSNLATVQEALKGLTVPTMAKSSIALPKAANDGAQDITVTWADPDNTGIIDTATGTVTPPSNVTTVTLVPTGTTADGSITATGEARTVTVFPQALTGTYRDTNAVYTIGAQNLIGDNWDFSQGLSVWNDGTGTDDAPIVINSNGFEAVTDGDVNYVKVVNYSSQTSGGGSPQALKRNITGLTAGNTYLIAVTTAAGLSGTFAKVNYGSGEVSLFSDTTGWTRQTAVFTAAATTLNIAFRWSNTSYESFELYELTKLEETPKEAITPDPVNIISGSTPLLPPTVSAKGTYDSTLTVDVQKWETEGIDFTFSGDKIPREVPVHGLINGIDTGVDITVNVYPETFPMPDMVAAAGQTSAIVNYFPTSFSGEAKIEFEAVFNKLVNSTITIGDAKSNNGNAPVFGGTGDAISIQTNSGGVNIRSWGANGGEKDATANDTYPVTIGEPYRFFITTDTATDTWSAVMTDKNGVAKKVAEGRGYRKQVEKLDSVTVLDNDSATDAINISGFRVYAKTPAQSLTEYSVTVTGAGANNTTYSVEAVSVDRLPIPVFDGYILSSRAVDGTNVTFTYEAKQDTLGTWAIRNNVTDDSDLIKMNYLGTHNSFANTDKTYVNEGGVERNKAGNQVDYADDTSQLVINNSKTQTLSALEQLNAGVRYFDIRLTRQSDGTFWTFHGPAFCDFRPIAATIAQFAKENPGEVIILDFHEAWDALYTSDKVITGDKTYNGETQGDDNRDYYTSLTQLLHETGLWEFMPANDQWNKKYGAVTNHGAKTVIIPVAKARGANCITKFVDRDGATSGDTTYETHGLAKTASYSQVCTTINNAVKAGEFGKDVFGIVHAYTTTVALSTSGGTLINDADDNRANWRKDGKLDEWMGYNYGNILLMNNVLPEDTYTYLADLSSYNRDGWNGQYGNEYENGTEFGNEFNGVTVTGLSESIPYSTTFVIGKEELNGAEVDFNGETYSQNASYTIDLRQYRNMAVNAEGTSVELNYKDPTTKTEKYTVKYTFPKISTDNTTVDVLLSSDRTQVLQTAKLGEALSYETTDSQATYILATVTAPSVNMTVEYIEKNTKEVLHSETKDFVIGEIAYDIKASARQYIKLGDKAFIVDAAAQNHTVESTDGGKTYQVELTLLERYAVLEDMLVDPDNHVWGINATNGNHIYVAANATSRRGPLEDDDGVTVISGADADILANARNGYLQFPVVTLGNDEAAIAYLYVCNWHDYTFNNGNKGGTIRFSATAIADDSWTTLQDGATYTDTKAPQYAGYTKTMFSNATGNTLGYIQIDVTELMKAAALDGRSTITLRIGMAWGSAQFAEREACVAGGTLEGNASYIDVVKANKITVTNATKVTKMGTEVTSADETYIVPAGETIRVYTDTATLPYVTDGTNVYSGDGTKDITPTETLNSYYAAQLGVETIEGAQVRIGAGVDAEGKIPAAGGSGLRFITTLQKDSSLATVTGATFGVEITAYGDTTGTVVDIPTAADKWQDDAQTVFTSALTNLQVSNYNRDFTATPYVKIGTNKYYGTPVTRSIYQVARGLLAKGYDGNYGESLEPTGGTDYTTMSQKLVDVLNAYVNQTGIRLTFADNAAATAKELTAYTGTNGAYTGEEGAFFTVGETTVDGTIYTVTLTPVGNAKINTNYYDKYVRINNNNSKISVATTLTENADGTYTLTFDTSKVVTTTAN